MSLTTISATCTPTTSATWASSASAASRPERVPGHVKTAADALGLSTDEVMSALKGGESLLDVADAQGVSRDDLLSALKAGAPQELQGSADADALVEALASATGVGGPGGAGRPGGAGGAGGHHGPPPAGATTGVLSGSLTSAQQTTLGALSDLLGTDADTLLGQLQSGTDLTDLLSQKGVTLDQLTSKLEEGLMVDTRA
jgi:hypothetical protein